MKAGIIGIGYWGSKVAKEYIALVKENVLESVSLCDADNSKLKPFVNSCKTFVDIERFLKDVNMVHICTPNFTHYEIAKKALEMDLNVLIEKPMTEDVNCAFDLVERSMRKGVILQVGHIFRFANVIRKIKELFENEEFGKQYYFNLEWTHLIPPIENINVLYDLLPHPLDILNFVTGKWPLSFKGIGKTLRRTKLTEAAFLQAIYDEFFANIHISWVVPIRRRKLEIIGSKKSIIADCVKQTATVFENAQAKNIKVIPNNTIREEILNFIKAVETGKNSFNPSVVGVRNVEAVVKAIASLR